MHASSVDKTLKDNLNRNALPILRNLHLVIKQFKLKCERRKDLSKHSKTVRIHSFAFMVN